MSLFFLLALPLFALLPQEKEYPDWFLYPAKHPGIVTGYSYNKAPALDHAAAVSCIYNNCILYGTLEIWSAEDIDRAYRNSEYYYYFSDKCAAEYKSALKPLDSSLLSVLKMDRITAFSTDTSLKATGKRIKESEITIPDWTEQIYYEEGGWLYGTGTYTSTGSDNDAWITAEEKAIFSIIQHRVVKISSYSETLKGSEESRDRYAKVLSYKLAARISGIEAVERCPNVKEKLFHVLVRIPAGGITFLGDDFDMKNGFKKHKIKQEPK